MSERVTRSVREVLRSALTRALKRRDRSAATVYRGALAAIDNAEAVSEGSEQVAGAIEASHAGAGRADAARRVLTESDMREIVATDARERLSAADTIGTAKPEAAGQLRAGAELLHAVLRGLDIG